MKYLVKSLCRRGQKSFAFKTGEILLKGVLIWSLMAVFVYSTNLTVQAQVEKLNSKIETQNKSPLPDNEKEKITASKFKKPIVFEPNRGQTDPTVKYTAHGLGYKLFMTANEMVSVFSKPEFKEQTKFPKPGDKAPQSFQQKVLRMKFEGASAEPEIEGTTPFGGKFNYLSKLLSVVNLPGYQRLNYKNLYEGVNATFYSNGQQLEYDFIVAPKTDVSIIRLKFEGADNIVVDADGNLLLKIGEFDLKHEKPRIYQKIDGKQILIEGSYIVNESGEVGFAVREYDQNHPLVIDPIISYSTYFGGNDYEALGGISFDKEGNAYITGATSSSDYPVTSGVITGTAPSSSNEQMFVSKFDASGQLLFSTYWGGSNFEGPTGTNVDGAGNIYLSGRTTSSDYPTTPGAFQLTTTTGDAAFATKLNSDGTAFVYSTFIGNGSQTWGQALDSSGNLYIVGNSYSSDFPATPGSLYPTINNGDPFICKLNSTGSALIYSTSLTDGTNQALRIDPNSVAVDASGDAYIAGYAASPNTSGSYPTTSGAFQTALNGSSDGFVMKINSDATTLIYSTFLGGSGEDSSLGIAVDSSGNAYVTGFSDSLDFPTTSGVAQASLSGNFDSFVTKLNSTGTALIYSTFLGGNNFDVGMKIKLDNDNNAFVGGLTMSTNFPVTINAIQSTNKGDADGFLTRINQNGTTLLYSTYFGDEGFNFSFIELDDCCNIYLGSTAFDTDNIIRKAHQPIFNGLSDMLLTKISFPSTLGVAADSTTNGSTPVTVTEYKLPAAVDTEVLDASIGTYPLQVELWASVYRPTMLTGTHPLLVFQHGMHSACQRNSTPSPVPPPSGIDLSQKFVLGYEFTGICDDPRTPSFDESPYYDVIENHRGYDYLGQNLASQGYIVVSINANRGIHGVYTDIMPNDSRAIMPRGALVLRHLQKLKDWNDCTTDPNCQTPSSLGVDLRGKIDFGNVGLMGHSRGGQGVRAAYNLYKASGSVWTSRIPGLNIKGIFEIAPTDFSIGSPATKLEANGTKWNVLIPICDGDVRNLDGLKPYDRMLLAVNDNPQTQKSVYTVWGANHNFYNTKWDYHDLNLDNFGPVCKNSDALFPSLASDSANQRLTALASVSAFFRANVTNSVLADFNKNFDPQYDLPGKIDAVTRVERNFTPSPSTGSAGKTTVFEDFNTTSTGNCYSGTNTCDVSGGAAVSHLITNMSPYHDDSLKVLKVDWTTPGNDRSIQINWRPTGTGANISDHQTFDFRIARTTETNVPGATNFSIQLVMDNGDLSDPVKLCNYAYVDGPVGGADPKYNSSGILIDSELVSRPVLQTVRIPLNAFQGTDLAKIRGIKFTFNESKVGSIFLANLRFSK